jgi:hypothetical protein
MKEQSSFKLGEINVQGTKYAQLQNYGCFVIEFGKDIMKTY